MLQNKYFHSDTSVTQFISFLFDVTVIFGSAVRLYSNISIGSKSRYRFYEQLSFTEKRFVLFCQ